MSEPTRPASPRQVLLGLFVLGQVAFLVLSNVLGFVKWVPTEFNDPAKKLANRLTPRFAEERGHGWDWTQELETKMRHWAQLTGQDQNWALFTNPGNGTGFPAILIVEREPKLHEPDFPGAIYAFDARNGYHLIADWKPGHKSSFSTEAVTTAANQLRVLGCQSPWEVLLTTSIPVLRRDPLVPTLDLFVSDNEPADIYDFVRIAKCRVRRYEGEVYLNLLPRDDETPTETAQRLNRRVNERLRRYHDTVLAYFKWRLKAWQRANPDRPSPKQVILLQRSFRIHNPDEPAGWDGPFMVPLARWQPRLDLPDDRNILESFDFTTNRFAPVN